VLSLSLFFDDAPENLWEWGSVFDGFLTPFLTSNGTPTPFLKFFFPPWAAARRPFDVSFSGSVSPT